MNMFAFYAVRGHSLDSLAKLSSVEKTFLHYAREEYYNEESEKYKMLFGEKR